MWKSFLFSHLHPRISYPNSLKETIHLKNWGLTILFISLHLKSMDYHHSFIPKYSKNVTTIIKPPFFLTIIRPLLKQPPNSHSSIQSYLQTISTLQGNQNRPTAMLTWLPLTLSYFHWNFAAPLRDLKFLYMLPEALMTCYCLLLKPHLFIHPSP